MALPPSGPWTGPPIYGGVPQPQAYQGYGYPEVGLVSDVTFCNHIHGEVRSYKPVFCKKTT